MNDLVVQTIDGLIDGNLETISEDIKAEISEYDGYVISEETVKDGKNVLAQFRKKRKELDDHRKDGKNRYMEKWNDFESKLKPVIALYDSLINELDKQVKEVEKTAKQAKRKRIEEIYNEVIGDLRDYIPLEYIYSSKWENATTSEKYIRDDMQQVIGMTYMAITTIKMNEKYSDKGLDEYKKTHDLPSAIQKMKDFEEIEKSVKQEMNCEDAAVKMEKHFENKITFFITARDVFHAETIETILNENGIEYERRV